MTTLIEAQFMIEKWISKMDELIYKATKYEKEPKLMKNNEDELKFIEYKEVQYENMSLGNIDEWKNSINEEINKFEKYIQIRSVSQKSQEVIPVIQYYISALLSFRTKLSALIKTSYEKPQSKLNNAEEYKKICTEKNNKRSTEFKNLFKNTVLENESQTYRHPNTNFLHMFKQLMHSNNVNLCNDINIYNLVPGKTFTGKMGVASIIKVGETELIMKKVIIPENLDNITLSFTEVTDKLTQLYPAVEYNKVLINDKFNLLYVSSHPFYNQSVMHLALNDILNWQKLYIYQYEYFTCGIYGCNIMEKAECDLSEYFELDTTVITDELLVAVLNNILFTLGFLQCKKFGFTHADLKCKNVFVKKSDNKYMFCIADYDKSSIFFNGIRFKCQSIDIQNSVVRNLAENFIQSQYKIDEKNNTYKLHTLLPHVFPQRSMSITPSTYDIYTFIYSMMREPKVWNKVYGEKKENYINAKFPMFKKIWVALWDTHEYNVVMEDLKEQHDKVNTKAINTTIPLNTEELKNTNNTLKNMLKDMRSIASMCSSLKKYKLLFNLKNIYDIINININKYKDENYYWNNTVPHSSWYDEKIDCYHEGIEIKNQQKNTYSGVCSRHIYCTNNMMCNTLKTHISEDAHINNLLLTKNNKICSTQCIENKCTNTEGKEEQC